MIKKVNEGKRNIVGFALIELIVIMAILGILSAVAVPRFGGFIANAQNRTNQVNAKTLTKTANVISATRSYYPTEEEWESSFTSMTPETAYNLISSTITFLGDGSFKYDPSTGIVSIDGAVPEDPEEPKEPEAPEEPTDEEILQTVLIDALLNTSNPIAVEPIINVPLTENGVTFKFVGSTVNNEDHGDIKISNDGLSATVTRHQGTHSTRIITMQGMLNGKVLNKVFYINIPSKNSGKSDGVGSDNPPKSITITTQAI